MKLSEHRWLPAAALIGVTVTAYAFVFSAGFIWDDDAYITQNLTLRSLAGLWQIWTNPQSTPQFYPLVFTTFWIEYHLWGLAPAGYHVVNVLLHAASAVLLWRLLSRLRVPGCWFAAAIFAVHPVGVESVAWITERKNVLSTLFYLLAMSAYLDSIVWFESARPKRKQYLISLGFFLLALFSKTVTATLPAAVLVLIWWRRGKLRWRDVTPLLPFFVIGLAMGSVTGYLERTQVGASGSEWAGITPLDRLLIASRAIWFYAGKLTIPIHLSFIYPRWWPIDPHQWQWYLWPVATIVLIATLWLLRRRIGRGPLAAVLLFFIGTLFPALGFVNIYPMRYSFVADHFQYLASITLICLFTAVIAHLLRTRSGPVFLIILLALTTLTIRRTFAYQTGLTLWRDTLARNPESWMVHANLGHALHAAGFDDQAWEQYQEALRLAPQLAEPHLNVALGHAIHGNFDAAILEYQAAIAINPTYPPTAAPAYANIAKAYLSKSDLPDAERAARQSIKIAPKYALGHYMLARALEQENQLPQAADEYRSALSQDPDDAEANFHLADCLANLGQIREATAHYQASLAIDPHNAPAWTTLGNIYLATGRSTDAVDCFQSALRIDPNLATAKQGLMRAGVR